MQLAEVVGTVVATVKDPSLESQRLLVIQPVDAEGRPAGESLVALDAIGVGVGERVLYVRGKEAAFPFLPKQVLADAGIVGKADQVDGRSAPDWDAR